MKIMHCPLNGPRNISEFVYGGEVVEMPDPATASDAEWADHVFLEANRRGPGTVFANRESGSKFKRSSSIS